MTATTVIGNVRPPGSAPVDVVIQDGLISEIRPTEDGGLPTDGTNDVIDGGGRLLFPGLVDAHTHMDKTLMGMGWHRNEVGPNLLDMIENERRLRRDKHIDSHQQSMRHARAAIATGTTHIRTHVDIDTEIGLRSLEGVLRTREAMAGALTMQIVAFPQSGMLVRSGTVELLDQALHAGADVMGGLDPSAIDRDPADHLDTVFALAERHGVDVDIHLHEPGELGAFAIELIAERTKVLGYAGRVVISHALALGGVDEGRFRGLVELLLEDDIAIMTHGPAGRRAIPDFKQLRAMGVRLCTGNDGIQDAWGPLNRPDMLQRIFIIAYRNNLRRDDDIEDVIDVATSGGAQVMGDQHYGLLPANAADLMLVDGETHVESVVSRPPRHLVMKRGRIVARDGVCLV